ncbi:uncharacterized protein SPSK_09855 [Sporothrix schenckii 1099-18]|uniref:NADAR domain-containing protein n=2 Tax=Sporothrix schenckii TaxID=29908 RepID=U7PYB4_SPOS1|nr:uncharacterized protein SPSK_09855 [Sporothrix schenckii 1099-18]ERS99906.1 hypothetical protein HMPREF1624_03274 [Sporothrix schenckii ATCC 58251]KJR85693.1 hypothetical protein SPSK_09855 [Sporothrix schenckii 1099-18]
MPPKHKKNQSDASLGPQDDEQMSIFFHKEWEDYGYMSNYKPAKLSAPDPAIACASWLLASPRTADNNDADETPPNDAPTIEFQHSEQYYMYCKAACFGDTVACQRILAATKASDCKDIARTVRGFDAAVWSRNDRPLHVMADALWHKFGGAHLQHVIDDGGDWLGREARAQLLPDIGRQLLETGDRQLVKAAGRDSYWGIGYGIK